ncbi:MAG: response regulator, partial [Rhodothermales bacterium]
GEDFVAIHVKDSGTGIPEKELPHIFDRFHQVEGATSRVQAGTGIGLALVKEVVELHEGMISVESELGVGTKFTITLPLGDSDEPLVNADDELGYTVTHAAMEETVVRDMDENADRISGDGAIQDHVVKNTMRDVMILVVDDNPDIREYMIGCLSGTYSVVSAKNGAEGYEKAKQVKPDLIISDVMMPVMTGYDLCRAIRADEDLRLTPIILVTSKTTVEEKIEGLDAGADDYLPKPFNAEELFARVRNLLILRMQQKAVQELNDMLQVKNVELADASELKSQLLRIAAHDLKNPLNNIREFANLIQEEIDPESEIAEMLGLIKNSSNKMLDLITQILESEALESGQLQIDKKPVDLAAVAAGVVEGNRKQAERKEQEIVFDVSGGDSYVIDGSEEWLMEAMENLISNAIKYSPVGKSIAVSVRREEDLI